jgi:hypothetical protein
LEYQQPPKEQPVTLRVVLLVIAFYLGVVFCLIMLVVVLSRIGR